MRKLIVIISFFSILSLGFNFYFAYTLLSGKEEYNGEYLVIDTDFAYKKPIAENSLPLLLSPRVRLLYHRPDCSLISKISPEKLTAIDISTPAPFVACKNCIE